jgi:hypothetical protein
LYAADGAKAFFMAYTAIFDQFHIRFPFLDFQIEVLHNLHLAPSQLHPNGSVFLQAFEVFRWANKWEYSSNLFLYLFGPYRGSSIMSWVSLCHRKNVTQMFIPWDDSVKVQRDLYVKVTPKRKDFIALWENANRETLFPLYWSAEDYTKLLICDELECGFLHDDDERTFNNLHDFFTSQGMPIHCRDVLGASRATPALCLCINLLVYFPLL